MDPRYQKQILFEPIGEAGQLHLQRSRVAVIGCGALGSVIAEQLARAGVRFLRLVDRDFVELSNLQRQVLYDESDVAAHSPKAIAAARALERIRGDLQLDPHVADVDYRNVRRFVDDVDVVMDGSDNFEVRFLINDACVETGTPWINGGCVGSIGQVMPVVPGRTACLACVMEDAPPPGTGETCDTAGVIGPAVAVVASLQTTLALKLLTGGPESVEPRITVVDVWSGTMRSMQVGHLPEATDCRVCRRGERPWLSGGRKGEHVVLCGRNAVQITPATPLDVPLTELAERLRGRGQVESNPFLVRLTVAEPASTMTIFRDGRTIVQGTDDVATARSWYARVLGS